MLPAVVTTTTTPTLFRINSSSMEHRPLRRWSTKPERKVIAQVVLVENDFCSRLTGQIVMIIAIQWMVSYPWYDIHDTPLNSRNYVH